MSKKMKPQTQYSFDEAKEAATQNLTVLGNFVESLHEHFLDEALLNWAIAIRTIENKVRQALGPCLTNSEILQIRKFGEILIQLRPELTSQLSQFWDLYHDIFKMISSAQSSSGYNLRGIINQMGPQIEKSEKLAERVVSTPRVKVSNILRPMSLLLVHVVRTQTVECALLKQLKDAVKKYGLQNKYDVYDICSVQSKVKKGSQWRTDVRAIRDATAHMKFEIHMHKNGWSIEFDNDEKGYNFHKHFSRKEFMKIFDLHTLLFKFQYHLLHILELLPILTTKLQKQP
ncbi:MAG: hypothetical protein ACE5K0_05700 [Candidatus Methanofastidiosia archaeon]